MTTETNASRRYIPILRKTLIGLGVLLVLASAIAYYFIYIHVTNSDLTFTNPLVVPVLLEPTEQDGQKIFELVSQPGQMEFFANAQTETMGYNGNYLGPTIRVDKGDEVVIHVTNQLKENTTVHWHGMHVPAEMDGTPHQPVPPGETWTAHYPILNQASTMWYHPHPHGQSAIQVFRGLVGFYIIDDENSKSLDLPNTYGVDDFPLAIQDRLFDDEGIMEYQINRGAYFGDEILVNGVYNPFVQVPAKQIRLRLLNGSNARVYHFGFDDDRTFHQIATDGGLLERPLPLTRIKLAPGERAEIIVDLSDGGEALLKSFPEDNIITLVESTILDGIGNSHFNILKIVAESTDSVTSDQAAASLPQILNTIDRWHEADADVIRPISLAGPNILSDGSAQQVGRGQGRNIPINGKVMDMERIDEVVMLDDVEIWAVTNQGGVAHPFHIHDIQFLILDRDGAPPVASEAGWKDTVLVDPGETVRFITQFTTYADPDTPFMYHCHILEHEDGGMMGQFLVVDPDAQ